VTLVQIQNNKFIDIEEIAYVDFFHTEHCMIIFKSGHKLQLVDKYAIHNLREFLNYGKGACVEH